MLNLKTTIAQSIDMSGYGFYAEAFRGFDRHDLAAHLGVDLHEIDENAIRCAQDQTSQINEGEFLLIELAN